jgi:pimeloyl-ACP methyl ester carboxylesterase
MDLAGVEPPDVPAVDEQDFVIGMDAALGRGEPLGGLPDEEPPVGALAEHRTDRATGTAAGGATRHRHRQHDHPGAGEPSHAPDSTALPAGSRYASCVDAPSWFTAAVNAPAEERFVSVEGASIHVLAWGRREDTGVVLVHGGAAHAHWWSFLAPLLATRHRVVALDLSGHGESGRRTEYPRRTWAREVMAVIADAGFPGPPVLVGHSMGGLVSIVAASLYGEELAGTVIVDAPVRRPDPESQEAQRGTAFREPKVYPDYESARKRFRLMPDQPCENAFIIDHVARHSLRAVEGGYTWKFDPRVFVLFRAEAMHEHLAAARCRVALFRGERSIVVPPETGQYMVELLGKNAPLVDIPEAHHHLILDQPLAFVAALRALLADWAHAVPGRAAGAAAGADSASGKEVPGA